MADRMRRGRKDRSTDNPSIDSTGSVGPWMRFPTGRGSGQSEITSSLAPHRESSTVRRAFGTAERKGRLVPHVDAGDTAWVLASTALVLFMTPGLAFFYGGMVRRKNVLGMLMQNYVVMGVVSVAWV
jgi:hypothetical protein